MLNNLLTINPQTIIFIILTGGWLSEFLLFPSPKGSSKSGQQTFNQILAAILLSISLTGGLVLFNLGNITGSLRSLIRIIGLLIYTGGLIIRYWSLILLGSNFSRGIQVANHQPLVSRGPYKILRHPLYFALFLLVVGATVFMANWIGTLAAGVLMSSALKNRIKAEEEQMEAIIGNRYTEWKQNRYCFLPYIY